MRLACAYAPQLALQAVLRRSPEWMQQKQHALVLAAGPGERARVVGLTGAALQAGVRKGMTVHQARTVSSERLQSGLHKGPEVRLDVVVRSEPDTQAAAAALADVGYSFAPRVEVEPGRVFFEVGDLMQLYSGGEAEVTRAIAARAARLGLSTRVAVAGSKALARAASCAGGHTNHVIVANTPSAAAAFLAPLPLAVGLAAMRPQGDEDTADPAVVKQQAELGERFKAWGVRTLGDLAALPIEAVALRLGEAAAALHRFAGGRDEEVFAPQLPPDAVEEGTQLDYALETLEPLAFLLRGLVDRALTRLSCRNLACGGLNLRLRLEPRGFDVREIHLAAPTRDSQTLLQLLRLDITRRPPSAPVLGADLQALGACVRPMQLDFLRPAGPAPDRMANTLARLQALVGPENVGAPQTVDSFKDEECAMQKWQWTKPETMAACPAPQPRLGIRRYRPPHPVEILMGRDGPTALRGDRFSARVVVAAGPYRVNSQWWKDEGWCRDYWDVHASDGALYRLHQDRQTGHWFVDGYYD